MWNELYFSQCPTLYSKSYIVVEYFEIWIILIFHLIVSFLSFGTHLYVTTRMTPNISRRIWRFSTWKFLLKTSNVYILGYQTFTQHNDAMRDRIAIASQTYWENGKFVLQTIYIHIPEIKNGLIYYTPGSFLWLHLIKIICFQQWSYLLSSMNTITSKGYVDANKQLKRWCEFGKKVLRSRSSRELVMPSGMHAIALKYLLCH